MDGSDMSSEDTAARVVIAVLTDLTGRSGFDSAWDDCDPGVQAEIRQTLEGKVRGVLDGKPDQMISPNDCEPEPSDLTQYSLGDVFDDWREGVHSGVDGFSLFLQMLGRREWEIARDADRAAFVQAVAEAWKYLREEDQ
jgi:hypothetical protein